MTAGNGKRWCTKAGHCTIWCTEERTCVLQVEQKAEPPPISLKSQMLTRTVFEVALTIAGWAILIAAVVSFFNGNVDVGIVLLIVMAVCFALSAHSAKAKPTLSLITQASLEALRQVERGQFAAALVTAEEADDAAHSVRTGEHVRPLTLAALSVARAVNGDMTGARTLVGQAMDQAKGTVLEEDMPEVFDLISDAIDRGVPDGRGLARDLLSLK